MKSNFTINADSFTLQLHSSMLDREKLIESIKTNPTNLKVDATTIENHIRVIGKSDNDIEKDIIDFFSYHNDIKNYYNSKFDEFKNNSSPLISCIILLTFNDDFILKQLIPSIIYNSKNHPVEIIIAYNGSTCDLEKFGNFTTICTKPYQVANGYNSAIDIAKGEYIALFHDDCILNDEQWIEKSLSTLSDKCYATTAEFHHQTAKFVPLVIKNSIIKQLGKLDEYYFFGIEDMDLTFNIYSHQKTIINNINAIHYRGMSTILLYIKEQDLLKNLFSHNILKAQTIRKIQNISLSNALSNGLKQLTVHYSLHFLNKYSETLKQKEPGLYEEHCKLNKSISQKAKDEFINDKTNILRSISTQNHKISINDIAQVI